MGLIPAMPQTVFLPMARGAFALWRTFGRRKAAAALKTEPVEQPDPARITIDDVPTSGQIVIEPDLARSIGERIAHFMAQRPSGASAPAPVVSASRANRRSSLASLAALLLRRNSPRRSA